MEIKEYLPIIIPLIAAQFLLLGYTIFHILKHDSYKRGNRAIWLAVAIIGMEFIGPIIYFVFGKEEE
jgi:hypothetical protein